MAGKIAALHISIYRVPVISAIRKAAVPMTGGIKAAPVHDTAVIAPENMDVNPVFFIIGMLKEPTVTALAVGLPVIVPKRAAEKFPMCPAAPLNRPINDIDISTKNFAAPEASRKAPKSTNWMTSVATTAMGVPCMPSSVRYIDSMTSPPENPL